MDTGRDRNHSSLSTKMSREFRAVLVDDERLARKELRAMLSEYPEIDVCGEADDVDKAIEIIREVRPDVVFLDIQMPGASGFDLLERIEATFKVIFVTAFDAYAIRAFEVNALDYLLKPINQERLARALERLSAYDLESSSEKGLRKLEYDDRLFLVVNDRSRFIKINAIEYICGAGDYSEIFTNEGQKALVLKSLREWEERLPEKYFSRIHRSTIVNLEYVDRIEKWFNHSYRIYLRNINEPFTMSRRYAAKLKLKFG
jgi:two-component system, LytTR family, response regulator